MFLTNLEKLDELTKGDYKLIRFSPDIYCKAIMYLEGTDLHNDHGFSQKFNLPYKVIDYPECCEISGIKDWHHKFNLIEIT